MTDPGPDPYAAGCAWVNGEFVPVRDAKVSIFDAGFTRSDVTYDVVGVWKGKFFRLGDHLDRFARSVEQLRLQLPVDADGLAAILHGCVARSGLRAAYVDMICTRGVTRTGSRELLEHKNRLYAYAIPYVWIVPEEQQALGTVLGIAAEAGIPARADVLRADDLRRADEAFLTSTAGGVMPVVSIDGRMLGEGKPGPLTTELRRRYWDAHDDPRWTTPVDYSLGSLGGR